MKKLLAVLMVSASLAACNNEADSSKMEAEKKSMDSTAAAHTADSMAAADKMKMMDTSMNKMTNKMDTGMNKMKDKMDTGMKKMDKMDDKMKKN